MKSVRTLLLTLVAVVGALAVYHFAFRGGAGDADALSPAARAEHDAMAAELLRAEKLFSDAYDPKAMKAVVEKGGLDLTPEQVERVLPMLHEHLVALRRNLGDAQAATLAGTPDAERSRFHVRAVKAHGAFQRRVREFLSTQQCQKLYLAAPSMIPPVPGSIATGAEGETQ